MKSAEELARKVMETFFTRWGYISSAAREQESFIASALREYGDAKLEEAAKISDTHGLLWGAHRGTVNSSTVPEEEISKAIRALKHASKEHGGG